VNAFPLRRFVRAAVGIPVGEKKLIGEAQAIVREAPLTKASSGSADGREQDALSTPSRVAKTTGGVVTPTRGVVPAVL